MSLGRAMGGGVVEGADVIVTEREHYNFSSNKGEVKETD